MKLFRLFVLGQMEARWVLAPTPEQAQVALLSALGYEPHETDKIKSAVEYSLDEVSVLPANWQGGAADAH